MADHRPVSDAQSVRVRRIYDEVDAEDGTRILIDRLWPRGISHESAALNGWFREIAPSTELRRWYGHMPDRFAAFKDRYLVELEQPEQQAQLTELRRLLHEDPLTLLTATKDLTLSHGPLLASVLMAGAPDNGMG